MNNIARYDQGTVRGEAEVTEEGYIKATAVVTRTGVFLYKNPDGTVRKELRHPDEVLLDESLNSIKMIPVTNGHPPQRLVTAENAKSLTIGFTGEQVTLDNQYILANFLITDAEGVADVIEHDKKELSLGYTVDLVPEEGVYQGEPYDFRQTNIRYNHLSLVNAARAGPEARIALDSDDAEQVNKQLEEPMSKRKIRIRGDDYMMEPEAAEGAERLLEDLRNLEAEKRRVEEEIAMIRDKLDKTSAERDSMRDKMSGMQEEIDRKMDAEEIRRGVKDRLKLYRIAERKMDGNFLNRMDSMSELDIKKSIVRAEYPNVSFDGKSDVYIQGRFDAVVEDMNNYQHPKATPAGRVDLRRADENNSESARDRMINKLENKKR